MIATTLKPAIADLVRAMARQSVREHLTRQREQQTASESERTNHVRLPASDKAA